jgi:hypothetical protein
MYPEECICSDVLSHIASYLAYEDYKNLYLINKTWNSVIKEYTMYSKFLKIIGESKIPPNNHLNLFYYSCYSNELDLARDILKRYSFKIDILNDIFVSKLIGSNYSTMKSILDILKIDYSKYDFLSSKERYMEIEYVIRRTARYLSIPKKNTKHFFYLRMFFTGILNIRERKPAVEVLHCFGKINSDDLIEIFNTACYIGNIEELEFLSNFFTNQEDIYSIMYNVASIGKMDILNWMLQKKEFKNCADRLFLNVLTCENNLEILKLIDKNVHLDQNIFLEAFILSCQHKQYECAKWLKIFRLFSSSLTEEIKLDIFDKCMKNSYSESIVDILELIYPISMLDDERLRREFLNACKRGYTGLVRFFVLLFKLPAKLKIEGFSTCCLKGYVEIAKFLDELIKVDSITIDKLFFNSVRNGVLNSSMWLYSLKRYNHDVFFAYEFAKYHNHKDVGEWLKSIMDGFDGFDESDEIND